MSSKSTGVLVAAALVLGALVFWVERPLRLARERPASRRVFPGLDAKDVTTVEVSPGGQIIRAERDAHVWRLTKPILYPADGARIEALLKALAGLEWRRAIGADELANRADAQEQFGFDKPAFSLVLEGGGPPRHLLFGKTSAFGDEVFLQVVGNPSIYLADASLLQLIPAGKDHWRDLAVLDLAQTPFDSLKVHSPGKSFDLQREPSTGLWRMSLPLQVRADSPKINGLLEKIRQLRVVSFASDEAQPDLDLYGLQSSTQSPALDLAFFQGTNRVLDLLVGASLTNNPASTNNPALTNNVVLTNNPALAYARRNSPGNVIVLPVQPLGPWEADYTAFLDRRLLSVSPDLIDAIEVSAQDHFTMRRQTNGQWAVCAAQTFAADQMLVEDWLSAFTNIEVEIEQAVVADVASTNVAGYGLAKPVAQYILKSAVTGAGNSNQVVAQIQFGASQTNRVFERRTDESSVNSITREQFDRFPRASWQFRDRRIWHFDAGDVQSITIRQGGRLRKLVRDPNNEWTFAPGSTGIINPFYLEETLHRLGDLKAIYWDGRGDDPRDPFGFAQTDYAISLEVKTGGQTRTLALQFGKPSPYTHPYAAVQLDGQRLVFEFPVDLYANFIKHDLMIAPAYYQPR
jgi:hypothetical protein